MDEPCRLPSALGHFRDIARQLEGKQVGLFLDYDGTLTPIVDRPELARLSSDMRRLLQDLSKRCKTAIVSGRGLGELVRLVQVDGLYYAGSHGFEIQGPKGSGIHHELGHEFAAAIRNAYAALSAQLGAVDGVILENKKYSLSVHYRLAQEHLVSSIDRTLERVLSSHPTLRRTYGKKVFEVRPKFDWHKGEAVRLILRMLGLHGTDAVPIYVGDDTTDEDAFRSIAGGGIGVLVADEPQPTAAVYRLKDPDEVRVFLARIAALLLERGSGS